MITEIEKEVLSKFVLPVKFDKDSGMIFDKKGIPVAEVRGWGHLQYFKNASLLQDTLGDMLATAFNEKYSK